MLLVQVGFYGLLAFFSFHQRSEGAGFIVAGSLYLWATLAFLVSVSDVPVRSLPALGAAAALLAGTATALQKPDYAGQLAWAVPGILAALLAWRDRPPPAGSGAGDTEVDRRAPVA